LSFYLISLPILAQRQAPPEVQKQFSAARRAPSSATAHDDRGLALGRSGNLPGAIAEFEIALKFKPDYAEAAYNLGVAHATEAKLYLAQRDYVSGQKARQAAVEAFQKALRL